jgi:hypothetical protein
MTDPRAVSSALILAHSLLAENHQPLTMTPGDLRKLLARYRRRLEDLADAVEPLSPAEAEEKHGRRLDRHAGGPPGWGRSA